MNLLASFLRSVEQTPSRTAVYWGDKTLTYRQCADQAAWVAQHLRDQLGVKPGDRVAIWLKNCPEFIPALYGILGAGAAVVPINNFLKPDEVAFILQDGRIDVLISEEAMGDSLARLVASANAASSSGPCAIMRPWPLPRKGARRSCARKALDRERCAGKGLPLAS